MKSHGWNPEAQQEMYIPLKTKAGFNDNDTKMSIEEAYEAAGKWGRYQFYLSFASAVTMISCMIYIFSVPLFLVNPKITCDGGNCDNVCETGKKYSYIDKHFNFVTEFDLYCDGFKGTIIEFTFGVISMVGCLLFATLSDSAGRIPVLIIGITGNIIGNIVLILFPSYLSCLIISGFLGFSIAALGTPTYTFLYDSVMPKYIAYYGTFLNVVFAAGEVMAGFILWTGATWRIMCGFICCWSSLFFLLLIWVREPPRFLLSKKLEGRALQNLKSMAYTNRRDLPENMQLTAEGAGCVTEQATSFNDILKILLEMSNICRILMCMLLFFCCGSVYYGISMNLQRFPGNVYVNAMLNGIVEIGAVLCSGFMMELLGKRRAFELAFSVTGIFMTIQGYTSTKYPFMTSINIPVSKFGISAAFNLMYVLVGELFPSAAKNTVLGICIITERLGCATGPLVGFNPTLFTTVASSLCFSAFLITCFMPLQVASAKIKPLVEP